jgi:hypothetical protein
MNPKIENMMAPKRFIHLNLIIELIVRDISTTKDDIYPNHSIKFVSILPPNKAYYHHHKGHNI